MELSNSGYVNDRPSVHSDYSMEEKVKIGKYAAEIR